MCTSQCTSAGVGTTELEDDFSGYRNGFGREREISIGTWAVEVRPPRVADTPGHIPPFRSSILPRGRSLTHPTQRLFARLYLEGLSSGDFEPAFRELLGHRAPLSSSTILRLKEDWRAEHTVWRTRPITERYVYIWSDGIYLGVGTEVEHSCLLVVIGARADGRKELLAMELGYRESTNSWADVLRDLRDRGLEAPMLAVGDGALGLWAALRDARSASGSSVRASCSPSSPHTSKRGMPTRSRSRRRSPGRPCRRTAANAGSPRASPSSGASPPIFIHSILRTSSSRLTCSRTPAVGRLHTCTATPRSRHLWERQPSCGPRSGRPRTRR